MKKIKSKSIKVALNVRKKLLKIALLSQSSHVGSALSIVDILAVVYSSFKKLKKNSFILSKGHGCMALYSVLNEFGMISEKMLYSYGKNNSPLMGHASHFVPGVDFSTGSLGHGLPAAVGISLAKKIQKDLSKTYVLLSDGELNEGSNWEALLFAAHHKLDKLRIIIDYNKLQSIDFVKNILKIEPLKKKFMSFGCNVIEIDGHNHSQLGKIIKIKSKKPTIIIANTIKGKGIKFMENKILWHYKSLDLKHFNLAMEQINEKNIY